MNIPVSAILAEMVDDYRDALDRLMVPSTLWATPAQVAEERRWAEERIEQRRLDRQFGPRLGPGRSELNAVTYPARLRQRNRAAVLDTMPGKRVGRFVRL